MRRNASNLGYGRAFVPDTSNIFVNVGLGFHLEMPLKDASEFLEHKEDHLQRGLEYRKQRMAQIKADIHEALHLIDLLVQIRRCLLSMPCPRCGKLLKARSGFNQRTSAPL
eukprot:TRINITY_DN6422_c0_g1_i1.p1 TRINITY_DN6422_c0_g1~~TRINITY_DN6422_c0_g1_i1.p1  ORF type:complete len:111 (-),score=18.69 TRINITY_DN6422_c0_g1_i1:81-413(-)